MILKISTKHGICKVRGTYHTVSFINFMLVFGFFFQEVSCMTEFARVSMAIDIFPNTESTQKILNVKWMSSNFRNNSSDKVNYTEEMSIHIH